MLEVPPEKVVEVYEEMLVKHTEVINSIIKDIFAFKLGDLKTTKVDTIDNILKLFNGSTPNKKKENLIEFLRLMPSFRTAQPEILERRLQDLKDELRKREGIKDLLVYAQIMNAKTDDVEEGEE